MHKTIFFVMVVIIVLITLTLVHNHPAQSPQPNVILITIDTLRADHLGFQGYPRATSPQLDYFSKKNQIFADFTVQSSKTLPSLATMFTSLYGHELALMTNLHRLNEKEVTLAELLKTNGYQTRAFSSNGNLVPQMGITQGFDDFQFVAKPRTADRVNNCYYDTGFKELKEPFFHWIHYLDPHGPYLPPSPFDKLFVADVFYNPNQLVPLDYVALKSFNVNYVLGAVPRYQQKHFIGNPRQKERDFYIARYDGEIRFLDQEIGDLLRTLKQKKLLNKSLIIITADHGEGLGEHDYYFEHGWFVYQDQIHVPLLIHRPAQKNKMIDVRPYSAIDLAPTILSLCNCKVPESFRGQDIYSKNLNGADRQFIYSRNCSSYPRDYAMIRRDPWKFIIDDTGKMELYNLPADPGERINLAEEKPELTSEFLRTYRDGPWREKPIREPEIVPKFSMDQKVRANLHSLGYVEN